ncbi:MAG: iron-containing alcohol dehydrogenase [Actinomycetia bacterium]|nr:iron-containing alcohol dehydrogenase [Actinomycetes bacterium]
MAFEFATAARIIFGAGRLGEIGDIARALGRHALVVTGRTPERAGDLLALLREKKLEVGVFPVAGEPEVDTVRRGTALARDEGCDCVIGFGGGAALDAAKAVAILLTNDGDVADYVEIVGRGKALIVPPVPLVAIPTTAGTGSEVTANSVLASPEHRVKVSLRSPMMLPRLALVDPELTYGLPAAVTAATGLDALAQLIEPFVSKRANPLTDGLCREGMSRAARSLRAAVAAGYDARAREDMALAGLFGGMALANAGLGAVHGLAGPLGGMIRAPHGALCAALLPRVVEANLRALRAREPGSGALPRYREVARLLTDNPEAEAEDAVGWLDRLITDLDIPRLRDHGLTPERIPELVGKAARASSMKPNPVELTSEELAAIVEAAL